jgi:hypothetical protein
MRKIALYASVLGLALSFLGCPPGDGADKTGSDAKSGSAAEGEKSGEGSTEAAGADISHVKVGQKYTYDVGNGVTSVWEVTEIKDGVITYTTTNMMNGSAVGDPTTTKWGEAVEAVEPAPDAPAAPEVKMTDGEDVTIGGITFNIKITETEANGATSKSSMCYLNGVATFPPYVKVETTGTGFSSVIELKSIE